jgi:hypothetical protein
MWWMLARIAGWNGGNTAISVKKKPSEFYIFHLPDNIIIKSNNQSVDVNLCSVYSIQGKLLLQEKIINNPIDLDISSLNSGIYIIILTGIQNVIPLKVLIP